MRIQKIRLNTGEEIPLGKFTVLVGPNNVGKSRTLRDIQTRIISGGNPDTVLVAGVTLEKASSLDGVLQSLGITTVPDPTNIGTSVLRGIGPNVNGAHEVRLALDSLRSDFASNPDPNFALGYLGPFFVSYMDASSRLFAAQSTGSFNPHSAAPGNLLQGLFQAGADTEHSLAEVFRETFGMDIKLDYSGMQNLTLRIAEGFGTIPADPREAFPIFDKYQRLDDQGDGFRSFAGVVLSALLSKNRIVLLDEPEAFLHPAQAKALGAWLAEHATACAGQMIVATHNAHFLAGIVSNSKGVDLFRLNRTGNVTTFTRIEPEVLVKLAGSPVLSSQRVLESMFYKGVAVCEADADRAIYDTVSSRIVGFREILFVHAHNKQTIKSVVQLLRSASIPTCAVADIDVLNSAADLKELLQALNQPTDEAMIIQNQNRIATAVNSKTEESVLAELKLAVEELNGQLNRCEHSLAGVRGALNRIQREASKWSELKRKGLGALETCTREKAEQLLASLSSSGLFVVPVGEFESWISVGISKKNKWIVKALELLAEGKCPTNLRCFVEKIGGYLGEKVATKEI